jgi:uncharacterized protein
MRPIFHLSFPVRDLGEAIEFYTDALGAVVGRAYPEWADIALFGAQITLQNMPADVLRPMPRTRHFGATIAWDDWEAIAAQVNPAILVEHPKKSFVGEVREQAKLMLHDPSGNLIEIKAYRNPVAVLGTLAA